MNQSTFWGLGLSLLSLWVCIAAAAAGPPIPSSIQPINSLTNITAPPPIYGTQQGCLPTPAPQSTLAGKNVAIILTHGAEYYTTAGLYAYFAERNATVTVYCPPQKRVISLNYYYPAAYVNCLDTITSLAGVDVLAIPDGYANVETLRTLTSDVVEGVRAYFSSPGQEQRVILTIGGASEMLISSTILNNLQNGTVLPPTSPSIPDALLQSHQEITVNATFNVTKSFYGAKTNRVVVVARNSTFMLDALETVGSLLTQQQLSVPGSCGAIDPMRKYPQVFTGIPATTPYSDLTKDTNTQSSIGPLTSTNLYQRCRNEQGIDFCAGWQLAVVVAHGSHDYEVITALNMLEGNGANLKVYCPEGGVTSDGLAYLMPHPATTPTYSVKCEKILVDWSFLAPGLSGTILIPHGPIATHGVLRFDHHLVRALEYTGTYSLYGSAMIMLTVQDIREDLTDVPHCRYTDTDLKNIGFNVSSNASTIIFRNHNLKRTKVLAGFNQEHITENFESLVNKTVDSMVWQSAARHKHDSIVGALFLTASAVVVLAVVGVTCYRTKVLARRAGQYDPVSRQDTATDLETSPTTDVKVRAAAGVEKIAPEAPRNTEKRSEFADESPGPSLTTDVSNLY